MKDSEFIELLNLYLDHEISPDKAARLEAEVARDPARRELYRQYCRIQKACVVLAEQFDSAPAQAAKTAALLSLGSSRKSHAGLWATGLVAAAACAAIILLPRLHPAATPAAAALVQSAPAAAPAAALARSDFQPVFVARALAPSAGNALFPAATPAGQFAWIQQVQVTPLGSLQVEPLLFTPKPALEFGSRPEGERPSGAGPEEKAAFQFQR
jgi:anti-sigma factor RsiW